MDFRNSIKTLYSILGFTKSNISIRIKSIKDRFIDFTVVIDEGEKCKVNKIIVNGNKYVNSTEFYKSSFLLPGDEFTYEKYLATQQNILRNEFLDPKKSFVNIDNENNIQMFVEEKLGFEPIFNIKSEKIREGSCCDACKCCKIGPAINIGFKFSNLNFRKLFHLRNKKYSFLGSGDIFSFQLLFSPVDSKLSIDLGVTVREITKNLGFGFSIFYSRNKGNIDSAGNNISDEKYLAYNNKGCCSNIVHNVNLSCSFILSSFNGRVFNLIYPVLFNMKIGKNKANLLRCNLNINIINDFKYSTMSHSFWEEQGYEFGLLTMITNPLCFLIKTKDINNYSLNKYLTVLFHFVYFKRIYSNFVFNASINLGYSKSFNNFSTGFKIEKEDSMYFDSANGSTTTFICINGIKENSILNSINSSLCNLALKSNFEMRYLFLNSPIINSYLFCFFNAGNLYLPSNKNMYKRSKFNSNLKIYNPFRFYSFGIGLRIEPELLQALLHGLSFSFYYDFVNMDFSFSFVRKR